LLIWLVATSSTRWRKFAQTGKGVSRVTAPSRNRRHHRVENFFERIKRYRRVATRYDKLAETFLGFVCLAILFTLRLT
jgi:transposase